MLCMSTREELKKIDDVRIQSIEPLISPAYFLKKHEAGSVVRELISGTRAEAARILCGDDDRLLVVVGPCSIHDVKAAKEYARRLLELRKKYAEDLLIIMRVYFEKPRTTIGWKGLINDPDRNETYNINKGVDIARKLLLDFAKMGMPAATEFLDTITPQYIADLIAWGAIGARTTESQVHRELASGLSMPVGFKNGTGGGVQLAVDAMVSASHPHCFLSVTKDGVSAIVHTRGNPHCHVILRGSARGTNYEAEHISTAFAMTCKARIHNRVMIDCSHGNSRKDYRNQPVVAKSIANQLADGSQQIAGVMIESYLEDGAQPMEGKLKYGVSVTDQCIGWDSTVKVLESLAQGIRDRRKKSH